MSQQSCWVTSSTCDWRPLPQHGPPWPIHLDGEVKDRGDILSQEASPCPINSHSQAGKLERACLFVCLEGSMLKMLPVFPLRLLKRFLGSFEGSCCAGWFLLLWIDEAKAFLAATSHLSPTDLLWDFRWGSSMWAAAGDNGRRPYAEISPAVKAPWTLEVLALAAGETVLYALPAAGRKDIVQRAGMP